MIGVDFDLGRWAPKDSGKILRQKLFQSGLVCRGEFFADELLLNLFSAFHLVVFDQPGRPGNGNVVNPDVGALFEVSVDQGFAGDSGFAAKMPSGEASTPGWKHMVTVLVC